jgi:hypothetical protein
VDKEPIVPIVPLPKEHVELPLSLEEMIKESRIKRRDTGNVVSVKEALYSYVYGRMIIFGGDDSSRQKKHERILYDACNFNPSLAIIHIDINNLRKYTIFTPKT